MIVGLCSRSSENKTAVMKKEVALTEEIIREKDPKCYGVWHHRRWIFDRYILFSYQKYLQLDVPTY